MLERHTVEVTYRGQVHSGEWHVEEGQLHLTSSLGSKSGPAVVFAGRVISLPSDIAKRMLWDLARAGDPKRSFFFWR